ncbi:MAG: transpeptidase family protein [Treponema sp.]|uniref:penicillin-binding protein n=1 Tax=Treponema sp. TaxID=166 RepID=UPI0025FD04FB|nr:penicillin-binding protein [Treponema sp.]MBQ8679265.1 transpeptidase family protein [Treponema sp.]
MQVNGYIKKGPLIFLIICAILFSSYVLIEYGFFAVTEPPAPLAEQEDVQRGSILDRNGKALAVPTAFYHFGASPQSIKNKEEFAQIVGPILNESEKSIIDLLKKNENSSFVYIKKKIDSNTYEELRKACSKNGYSAVVKFDKLPGRVYPENELASQLIGFVGADGQGLAGIEYSMQETLLPSQKEGENPIQGKNIYLTIDANLQSNLEKIAHEAMETTQAESMMLIATEAKTGEVLSYISLPSANLNDFSSASKTELKNKPASDSYEPGSVFKIFSVASFLDTDSITTKDIFNCDGIYSKKTGRETIRITCLGHHGWETAREALKYSCNDALAQMSEKIDSEPFLAKLHQLGFGERPGTEISGETPGVLRNPNDRLWSARSKPTIAIGQEITVSALQMVQAATAIANGGIPVQLTFVNKITDYEGREEFVHTPALRNRVFKKETTDYILDCMETVATSGTGAKSRLEDVSMGVKTGTAQMADPVTGGYSTTDFVSNCMAIFPIENPEIILYIVIEKAKGETYAGRIVAPVIKQAADVIIDHLGMSRGKASSLAHSGQVSIAGTKPIALEGTVPDFRGMPKRQLLPLLNYKNIRIKINGDGWVKTQDPAPGTPLSENMEIELYLE